ncbi:hypothetical protein TUM3792_42480 [Shewanella sp. MBTL60-007]|nr:hypothetical protein TUM3792_42480 [Shewanella sp. MBTL60-007]
MSLLQHKSACYYVLYLMRNKCGFSLVMLLLILYLLVKSTDFYQKNEFIQRDLGHVLRQHMLYKEVNVKLVFGAIKAVNGPIVAPCEESNNEIGKPKNCDCWWRRWWFGVSDSVGS